MRLVFFGTPPFAVPSLERLVSAGHDVLAVYTQPDRPKGRGRELSASAVKLAAGRLGLPVRQPERVRRPEVIEELSRFGVDAMVVVGYGQIIPPAIIELAPLGIINVHASLLPKYRGAAPIQWCIANGETVTGVTTMRIDAGLDTGDILLQREVAIGPAETASELSERLSAAGASLLIETLVGLEAGTIVPRKQDDTQATYAPVLHKEDGRIDWSMPAAKIYNRVRGFVPWPGMWTKFRGRLLHVWKASVVEEGWGGAPGEVKAVGGRLIASCGGGTCLELLEVQVEGRKRIAAPAFLSGQRLGENERFGEVET